MVCDKCEKKLGSTSAVAVPDKWKEGAANTHGKAKLGENKLLQKKNRYTPYASTKCTTCKTSLSKPGHMYCHGCAYKKGICEMCGKQVLDVSKYKQTM